ncbi:unnamed protein product, partial [Prorocentrum cordatum]
MAELGAAAARYATKYGIACDRYDKHRRYDIKYGDELSEYDGGRDISAYPQNYFGFQGRDGHQGYD